MTRAHLLAPALAAVLFAAPAFANDVEAALSNKVAFGDQPSLTLEVRKDVKRLKVQLRSDKGGFEDQKGPVAAGESVTFRLPHKEAGRRSWSGDLEVSFADGSTGAMPLAFGTEVLRPLGIELATTQQQIQEEHAITLKADRPVAKVEVEVYGDDGVLIASQGQAFEGAKPGTPLTVRWLPGAEGPVLRVKATVFDQDGNFRSTDVFPHVVSVAHEEVIFESGKADIRPAEEAKLKATLDEVRTVVRRYAKAVQVGGSEIRLFVSGHTDTVGPHAANRELSRRRARAIGLWFKQQDLGVPVYVRGFGEEALKVPTPDETDEERNRRADYDIGVDGPTGSLAGWTRL
jgi:outer membrane protein OmpA-like peptidoglycan-associated protein